MMTRSRPASRARSSGSVTWSTGGRCVAGEAEHELGGVQDLHRQPSADLHLLLVERGVQSRVGRWPPASAPRPSRTVEHLRRAPPRCPWTSTSSCGPDPSRSRRSRPGPRQRVVLEVRPHHAREQPGPDDLVRVRVQVHREGQREELLVPLPAADDLRAAATTSPRCPSRRGRP